ncbi:MAG: SAM-dependent methyltransferase [Clostridia bacterium]|nr:SAM-dependent methyltransferase [Clostridia bacterium]
MEKLRTALGNRLMTVARFVEDGERIADIGTDHAYLPVYLVTNGVCPTAVASDIGEGPLRNAEKIVVKTGTQDRIRLIISDGLDGYGKDDADVFVFAGMGGTLISELLDRARWVRDGRYRFIFQPMSRSEELIEYLIENGFELTEERSCFEGGRCYIVFCAKYSGEKSEYRECFPYVGLLPDERSESSAFYINRQYKLVEKRLRALEKSNKSFPEQKKLMIVLEQMKEYL